MDNKHLTTLEFPKILEQLSRHTGFSVSRDLALSLQPSPHLSEACQWQSETSEARRLLSVNPDLSVDGARDLQPLLQQGSLGAVLLPYDLLNIRQTLLVARTVKRSIMSLSDRFPYLADIVGRMHECPSLVQEIERSISDRGDVLDSASVKLGHIRKELEVVHQRLLDRLNRIVSSADNQPYLQEAFVTQRQGRYVIPLRAEFKGRIQGVIHDQSSSGATLFVEPMSTVDQNNQWRQLQLDEEQEVNRVLLALSQRVDEESSHIRWTLDALADLDLALAKARYAEELLATEPLWPTDKRDARSPAQQLFDLRAARHPLLDPETVVPVDVVLPPDTFILVITGPNTGGKTVTLKTIGLMVAMAQAGMQIPALEGSSLPFFHTVYADIGDEQSIEQSLSTFSGHLTNIVNILESCDRDSLVVLDELGAGTDPVEGSALARAILEHLKQRGVTTFVATHYSELKAYAHNTQGVVNASVEFDAETLAPTFRLRIGLPGRSNAFAIAERLGLDPTTIDAARSLVTPEAQQTESMLADIQIQLDVAKADREKTRLVKEEAQAKSDELSRRLSAIDEERRNILNSAWADARREIKTVREELRRLRQKSPMSLPSAAATSSEKQEQEPQPISKREMEAALDKLEAKTAEDAPPQPADTSAYRGPLQPGDVVWVLPYQALGEVINSQRGQVEVQLGRFRAAVRRRQVELRHRAPESDSELDGPPESAVADVGDGTEIEHPSAVRNGNSPGMELDLRGLTADEALLRLDRYLDEVYLAELPWVHIIHGKGSGVLRTTVREALRGHPQVASYRSGEQGEGGDGVTVAKLAIA